MPAANTCLQQQAARAYLVFLCVLYFPAPGAVQHVITSLTAALRLLVVSRIFLTDKAIHVLVRARLKVFQNVAVATGLPFMLAVQGA